MVDYLDVADRSWPVLGPIMRAHAAIYRVTGGRVGRRLPGLPPMLLLDHVGARSGRKRTTPLVYLPADESFVIVAAKGGHPRNPAWVHNLRAHPRTEIQVGRERVAVEAREAGPEERHALWPQAIAHNPVWERYRLRTDRTIPIFILEPRDSDPSAARSD